MSHCRRLSDRLLRRPDPPRHRLVDDDDGLGCRRVVDGELRGRGRSFVPRMRKYSSSTVEAPTCRRSSPGGRPSTTDVAAIPLEVERERSARVSPIRSTAARERAAPGRGRTPPSSPRCSRRAFGLNERRTRCSVRKPGSIVRAPPMLRSERPATISRTSDAATWRTTSAVAEREPPARSALRRPRLEGRDEIASGGRAAPAAGRTQRRPGATSPQ